MDRLPKQQNGTAVPAYAPGGYCPVCGYPKDVGVCPECGRFSDEHNLRLTPPARRRRRVAWVAAGILAVLVLAFISVWIVRIVRSNWSRFYSTERLVAMCENVGAIMVQDGKLELSGTFQDAPGDVYGGAHRLRGSCVEISFAKT
jgi:hypothetical protein